MVARIAPSPIVTSVASSDSQTQAVAANSSPASNSSFSGSGKGYVGHSEVAQAASPPLPGPPGEAFAAAIIAGRLPPRPATPEQLRQRLRSAWQPPASPLRLMDRTA